VTTLLALSAGSLAAISHPLAASAAPDHPAVRRAAHQVAFYIRAVSTPPVRRLVKKHLVRRTRTRALSVAEPVTEPVMQPVGEPTVSGDREAVLRFALAQVGQRYRRGGSGRGGWDCSGLVSAAYRTAGVNLPHSSGAIGRDGRAVPPGQWQPGDVIHTSGHVALYLGHGMMVEAANPHAGVRVTRVRGGQARRF
jgi:cell wall-associated NlpC family hydrolase